MYKVPTMDVIVFVVISFDSVPRRFLRDGRRTVKIYALHLYAYRCEKRTEKKNEIAYPTKKYAHKANDDVKTTRLY